MNSNWISVDPKRLHGQSKTVTLNGIDVEIGLSPFDIPQKVSGRYDDAKSRFVIEFEYLLNDEPKVPIDHDESVSLIVGEHSGCLYQIWIDVNQLNADLVRVRVFSKNEIAKLAPDTKNRISEYLKDRAVPEPRRRQLQLAYEAVRSLSPCESQ